MSDGYVKTEDNDYIVVCDHQISERQDLWIAVGDPIQLPIDILNGLMGVNYCTKCNMLFADPLRLWEPTED